MTTGRPKLRIGYFRTGKYSSESTAVFCIMPRSASKNWVILNFGWPIVKWTPESSPVCPRAVREGQPALCSLTGATDQCHYHVRLMYATILYATIMYATAVCATSSFFSFFSSPSCAPVLLPFGVVCPLRPLLILHLVVDVLLLPTVAQLLPLLSVV